MKRKWFILVAILLLLFVSSVALAQEKNEQEKRETKFGVGMQACFPAWGISGMMDVGDNISAQGIFGIFGDLKTYAVRGIYRFRKESYWNVYGYGMIGGWSYTCTLEIIYMGSVSTQKETDTAIGFGAGAGIGVDWRILSPKLPPIEWNLEIGLARVGLENYDFSTITFGTGLHYRF